MILAALAGGVVAFLLGWLVFGMLLASFYEENMVHYEGLMRGENDMRLYGIALANLSLSAMFAYIFDRCANFRTFASGFTGALIIGLLTFTFFDMMMWSTMNMFSVKTMVIDIVVNAVFAGIIGGVVGMVLGSGKKAA